MIAPLIIGDEGHPVFDLNASALLALTGQSLTAGNFAVVEQNESNVDLEPVVQDANGTWFPTQASDYVNLVPNRFALFDDLKQWFDDRNLQPVGFFHVDDHGSFTDGNGDSSIPTANLQLWLDGLDIDGDNSLENNPTAGTKIASWKDKSSNGYHANQELVDEQPTVSENGGLSFNGIRNHLTLGSNYIFSENDGMTIFAAVYTDDDNQSGNTLYSFGSQGSSAVYLSTSTQTTQFSTPIHHDGNVSYAYHEESIENLILTSSVKFLDKQIVRVNGHPSVEDNVSLNSINDSTINSYPTREENSGPVTIGGQSKTYRENERFFSGIIREILVYDRALPEAEILQIESYLTEKWHNASGIDSNQTQPNTAPHFQSDGNLSVSENQTFVYEFNASDPDANTTLSYSILSGEDAGKFTLNSTTGGLSFTTAPDFESPEDNNSDNIYELSIQVSDGESQRHAQCKCLRAGQVRTIEAKHSGAKCGGTGNDLGGTGHLYHG